MTSFIRRSFQFRLGMPLMLDFQSALGFFLAITFSVPVFAQNEWQIEAKNIDPNKYFGVTVANGMVGLVSSPNPMQVKEVVLNGAFDTYGRGRVSNIMKVFSFANMDFLVEANGQGALLNRDNISNFAQTLDMKNAKLITNFDYKGILSVKHEMMALRHLPHTAMINVEVSAKQACDIIPASVIESPDNLKDVKNFYAEIDRPHIVIPLMTSVAKSPTGRLTLAVSNSFLFDEPHGQEPRLIHEEWDNNRHLLKFRKKLQAGQTYRFSVIGSVISTAQSADPQNEAERMTIFAALEKKERLLQRHQDAWAKLWESDIIVEGDPEAQRDIHSAIYHLYSFVREGTPYSLSPMGLSGLGYNGHVFWDTELWMYPPLLTLHPELAKSPMEYRFKSLEAAKANAVAYGYRGAKYPWEGDDTGQEGTPVWALSGPFEHHITGCVGYAVWKYYQVTKDKAWLEAKGYPILKEVADFWAARVELGKDGKYHIMNVVCADEWAENVDDNAFTNGIAKTVLGYAAQAATVLGKTPDPLWKTVADNIVILRFPDGTTREHATYNGEPIKQADVNLLSYPLSVVTDPATVRKDLDYYWKTLGDNIPGRKGSSPAMAHGIFSILNARLGNTETAYMQYLDSYKPNAAPPFGVLAETAGGTNPYFATGAGGFLQTLINGWAGLDITDEGIVQKYKPKLPKYWKSLTIKGVGVNKANFTVKN
ncbi:MAG: glycoside hydrolase family 65 protein [Spirosomaceae bacterium]|nr:glycoside hydrolase family 65 protein [Spirosomataceae bacterium]